MSNQAALGITIGLLVASVLAATAGMRAKAPDSGNWSGARAVFGAGLAYFVVFVPVFVIGGINIGTLILMALIVVWPVVVATLAGTSERFTMAAMAQRLSESDRTVLRAAMGLVTLGLVVAILIAAGQILSLVGRVNPIWATIGVGVVACLYVLGTGLRGAARTSRYTFWVLAVAMVLVVAIGLFVGRPGDMFNAVLPVENLGVGSYLAVVLVITAIGFFDPALRRLVRRSASPQRSGWWGAVWLFLFVMILGIGLLWLYGGSFVAPSLEFYVIPANLPALPLALPIVMAILALLIASVLDNLLAAGSRVADAMSEDSSEPESRSGVSTWTIGLAVVGIVIAVIAPRVDAVLLTAAIIGAAALGALVPRILGSAKQGGGNGWVAFVGPLLGIGVAAIYAVIAGFSEALSFTTTGLVAILLAGIVSLVFAAIASTAGPSDDRVEERSAA